MARNAEQILDDLVNLNADDWNSIISDELNIPVSLLKELTIARELKHESKTKISIYKDIFNEIHEKTKNSTDKKEKDVILKDIFEQSSVLDKYVVEASDGKQIINSLSCTGKIIVGLDLYNAYLEDSYFCNCTFYNCNFSGANFVNSVFNSCTINNCDLETSDFTASTISRTKFMECNLRSVLFEYSVLTDNAFIGCSINQASFRQSKILFTGFNECKIKACDFKEVEMIQMSAVDVDFTYSDFKRSRMCDVILVRTNLKNCNFDAFSASAITHNGCYFDDKYKDFFKMEHHLFSPSIFEWEKNPDSE